MLVILQLLSSILGYVVAILELLSSFGPVLALLAGDTSLMKCMVAILGLSTRPGGMREAME